MDGIIRVRGCVLFRVRMCACVIARGDAWRVCVYEFVRGSARARAMLCACVSTLSDVCGCARMWHGVLPCRQPTVVAVGWMVTVCSRSLNFEGFSRSVEEGEG